MGRRMPPAPGRAPLNPVAPTPGVRASRRTVRMATPTHYGRTMSMDPSFPRTANTDPAVPGAEEEPPLLVLASRSPGRARILQDAGVDFETIVSDVDE